MPHRWREDLKLAAWVGQQRQRRKKGLITDEQVRVLDELGFTWQHRERGGWKDRDQELVEFRAEHGHCNVPHGHCNVPHGHCNVPHGHCKVPNAWPENPLLGRWVSQQRQQKKSGKLHPKREEMLNAIGFDWGFTRDWGGVNPKDLWALRYDQLVEFKNQNGHCDVAYNHPDNRQLGIWVSNQRQKRKQNKLTPERERLLNALGFIWSVAPRLSTQQESLG